MHFQTTKRILLVEDHPLVADATRTLLLKMDTSLNVFICDSAPSAIETFRHERDWHRILLDINVPHACGLSLVRTFHRLGVAAKCAVVTATHNQDWSQQVQAMGLLGYVVKAANLEDFTQAMQHILHGQRTFPISDDRAPTEAVRLTRRQQEILQLLHRGLASKEVAAELGLSLGTVNNHVTGLMRVLGVTNRTHAVSRAMDLGYLHDYDTSRAAWH
nr:MULTISPECIES: response regulator transcription factor [Pseudomonas]